MRPETPIRIITHKVDPYSKQALTRPFAEFDVQGLGIDAIEGVNVTHSPPVRLPDPVEPGALLDLHVAFNGAIVAVESDGGLATLFDTPQVIVTDLLTIQLLHP